MKTLITGAPGWLGTTLVETLIKGSDEFDVETRDVRCLVLRGTDTSYLKELGAEIVEGDLTDPTTLMNVANGVDTVIHCAGLIHPKFVRELHEINTRGTENMITAASYAGVKRFVFISSNSPAGTTRGKKIQMTESTSYNPYMAYGRSKADAEKIVTRFQQQGKIETVIIRPCWFYGPNQPARQSRFFNMIKAGNPLVFGDGSNLRSMSYVDNIVQGIVLAEKNEKANGQIYWIADERPYPTIEIYRTVADLLGVDNFQPRHVPGISCLIAEISDLAIQATGLYWTEVHVVGEMNKNIACSIEKAKKELGYQPKIDLREGMKRSIEWCRKNGMDI
ncbi:MAG: NAD-dependent epimerase/dehydratase family protein [Chitinivibrionales bacterium]|nr:NAD-dependent epimerase/dehydratase family protein [Chitinivibrionales bacterium]